MTWINTATGEKIVATLDFITRENTRLMLEHRSNAWTNPGLWKRAS